MGSDKEISGDNNVQVDTSALPIAPDDQQKEQKLREKTQHIGQQHSLDAERITKEQDKK